MVRDITYRIRVAGIAAAFLFAFTGVLVAQSLSVKVSKNPVAEGEQFQVTFSFNASGSAFRGPAFGDFDVLGGPNASTSIQIINGQMSQTQTFSYYLRARNAGSFQIREASIRVGDKEFRSPSFRIDVVKGRGGQSPQGGQQEKPAGAVGEEDVFIRLSVDKQSVYQGEGLIATYKLYTRVSLVNYAITKAPALNGFWTQDIPQPSQLNLQTVVLNGVQYHTGILKKVVLYPQQSGKLSVDGMEGEVIARVKVQRRRNTRDPFDVFNDPFFSNPFGIGSVRDVKVKLRSRSVKVKVRPLPGNAPASFNGSVGSFSFDAGLDKSETGANDPVTLRIEVKGKGNLSLVDPPLLDFPPDIESYEPKVIDNYKTGNTGTSGKKVFEFLLIPRRPGTYKLPRVAFSYFDLNSKRYREFVSDPFTLKVSGTTGPAAAEPGGPSRTEVALLGKDIRFIRTGPTQFIQAGRRFFGSAGFWSLALGPGLLFAGLLLFKRRRDRESADLSSVRRRKATAMARKRLQLAKKKMEANEQGAFYDETANALWGYIGDKLSIPNSGLSREAAIDGLKARRVNDQLLARLNAVLDQCELARYAGGSADPRNTYGEAVGVITSLEDAIK